MTKQNFLNELEDLLDADGGAISEDDELAKLSGWDSLGIMSFIALVDEKFSIELSAAKLAAAKKVSDLIVLLGDNISN